MQPTRRHADPAIQAEFNQLYGSLSFLTSAVSALEASVLGIQTAIELTIGTTAPVSPVPGQRWLDTNFTPSRLKTWDGSNWRQVSPGVLG